MWTVTALLPMIKPSQDKTTPAKICGSLRKAADPTGYDVQETGESSPELIHDLSRSGLRLPPEVWPL